MRVIALVGIVLALAGAVMVAGQQAGVNAGRYSDPLFSFETDGLPRGKSCLQIFEDKPKSYDDNYICTVKGSDSIEMYGITFAFAGIVTGRKCVSMSIEGTQQTQQISDKVVERWNDNYICVPWESHLEFVWTEQKPVGNRYDCLDLADTDFPHYYLCYRQERSIDCAVSAWSEWEACSAGCGVGSQTRSRAITQQPANDGQTCPNLLDKRECEIRSCDSVLGWPQRIVWYIAALAIALECVVLFAFLAPLPGGYRAKFIKQANSLWDGVKNVRYAVFGVLAVLGLAFLHCLWVVLGIKTSGSENASDRLDLLTFGEQLQVTGFGLLMLLLIVRFQAMLKHYMSKDNTANKAALGGGDDKKNN